jgi:hypothetical protein
MTLTKKKDGNRWRIYVNGKPTGIQIERSLIRKEWGSPQMWDVFTGEDEMLFEANSLDRAMRVIGKILEECGA